MKKREEFKYIQLSYEEVYREMVERGKDCSAMIRLFLNVKYILPSGPAEQLEIIARRYALRNDKDRGSVQSPGSINFLEEGWHGAIDRPKKVKSGKN